MLTRPEVDEANAKANSHEAETQAKITLIFFSQMFHFDSIFSKKEILGRFSTGLQKFRLKTSFSMSTLLVNSTSKTTRPS